MLVRRALAVPGFNPDDIAIDTASGMTLLMWAATSGQDEIVRLLLRRGAGVNTVQKRTAMTALMHAAEQVFINGSPLSPPPPNHTLRFAQKRTKNAVNVFVFFPRQFDFPDQDFDLHRLSVEFFFQKELIMFCSVAKQTCKKRVNERSGEMVTKLKLDLFLLVISVLTRFHCTTIGAFVQLKAQRFTSGEKTTLRAFGAWLKNVHQNKKVCLLEFLRMGCCK